MKLQKCIQVIAVLLFTLSIAIFGNGNQLPAHATTVLEAKYAARTGDLEIPANRDSIPDNTGNEFLPLVNKSGKDVTFTTTSRIQVNGGIARWDYGPSCQSGLTGDGAQPNQICAGSLKFPQQRPGALIAYITNQKGDSRVELIGYSKTLTLANCETLRIFNNDNSAVYRDNQGIAVVHYELR